MAQQTTLIPLAARTSTLIVDSDLDLGAFELIADKVVATDGTFVFAEADGLKIQGGRIVAGNDLVGSPPCADPVVIGFQTFRTLAHWSMPDLFRANNTFRITGKIKTNHGAFPVRCLNWLINVDGDEVDSGSTTAQTTAPEILLDTVLTDIDGASEIEILVSNWGTSNPLYSQREVWLEDLRLLGDLEAFWCLQGAVEISSYL